ncbi:DUF3089 domain-containing protein [Sphingomonas bacterium]|uniref:DUF3089 domain-containing protein n=1 Tax=Sphingomonas bacterium TaxID=1895847 RepID=UPI00262A01C9|nr:DUF3089 domain-containing protein [Sphingomonas bacterium]MDB5680180.1 hypothetical protein [Sphingomonas bacterium]
MARKFLYAIVVILLLVIAGAFALRFFGPQLSRWAFVPSASFEGAPPPAPNAYADAKMWLARPDIRGNPATWTPSGYGVPASAPAAVFFIHPTSYLNRAHWNAPLDNEEANGRAALFLRGQASVFNDAGQVWAPRYRQATLGAFLTSREDATKALDFAYRDVAAAFDEFLKEIGPDRPIILAGHSQGGAHLLRLLRERVAGKPLARRIVAAYAIGWPISKTADLPSLGLPECARPDQAGCILSWQSYAEPSDTSMLLDYIDATSGPTGVARRGTAFVCTNPLTGTPNADAPAKANIGTLVASSDFKTGTITVGAVPAKCVGRGFLSIGGPVDIGPYVLPGNNYHVFDYSLFWANVRADAVRRLKAFSAPAPAKP